MLWRSWLSTNTPSLFCGKTTGRPRLFAMVNAATKSLPVGGEADVVAGEVAARAGDHHLPQVERCGVSRRSPRKLRSASNSDSHTSVLSDGSPSTSLRKS